MTKKPIADATDASTASADAKPAAKKGPPGIGVHAGLEAAALELLTAAGDRMVDPADVARMVGGNQPAAWSRLMPQLRIALVKLAHLGRIVIYRKGEPVDPDEFRGLYRIGRGPEFDGWEM